MILANDGPSAPGKDWSAVGSAFNSAHSSCDKPSGSTISFNEQLKRKLSKDKLLWSAPGPVVGLAKTNAPNPPAAAAFGVEGVVPVGG